MSLYSKVSWKDGMFLLPQHFQQADRCLEAALHLRFQGESALSRGILSLQLNEAAIAQGRLELVRCQAIFPDGLTLDVPDIDFAPPSRTFQLPASARNLDIYLTVPGHRTRTPLIAPDTARADVRFVEQVLEVPDDHDPSRTESIDIASKNLRFALSGEPLDGLVAMKIARIHRGADGLPALEPGYVPPSLRLSASPVLVHLGRELLGMVSARVRSLGEERRVRGGNVAIDFNATDVLSFWFLHTLNLHRPVLQHLLDLPGVHPARFYEELLRLAGSLSTFASADVDLPVYDHDALAECFGTLDRRLRELLSHLFTTRYELIPLVRKETFWVGHIADRELRVNGDFLLAASGEIAPSELVARLPNACKIAELDGIERLVRTHVGGVRISHVLRPPSSIPVRGDTCYFQVHTDGSDWDRIKASGQIAAYVPTWLPGIKLELIGIRAGEAA